MNTNSKALPGALLLAALFPFALRASEAQPAKPQEPAAPAAETSLHEVSGGDETATPTPTASPGTGRRHRHRDEDDRVSVGGATVVRADEMVRGNAVAVLGPVTVDGTVEGNAVTVLGSNTINGTVHGNGVAVLGDLTLGPKARLDGNAVSVGGRVNRDPTAVVGGNIVEQNLAGMSVTGDEAGFSWPRHGLDLGRPLAIGRHLRAFWIFSLGAIALYLLLALVFPGGVTRCADTLAQRPGITILTGFLAILGLPVLFILLFITVVGIPVAVFVLPLLIMACVIFGKTGVYCLVGRSIAGRHVHPVLAALVGIALFVALSFIPVAWLMVWCVVAFLGFACALTTVFVAAKPAAAGGPPPAAPAPSSSVSPPPPPAAPAPPCVASPPPLAAPVPAPTPAEAPLSAAAPAAVSSPAALAPPPLPPLSEAALPRAGLCIRMAALLIDAVIVAIVIHLLSIAGRLPEIVLLALAVYGAVLWKLRGSTIGGIVFGLKVVRHDGSPLDWSTAVVRALACFLSLVFLGLGFFWIAIDAEKQGWHDKIAGTVVVRLPRSVSLV